MTSGTLDTSYLRERVRRWQEGDAQGAEELLRLVEGWLRRLVGRMLRGFPHLAARLSSDDVYQGAVHRLLRTLRQFTPASTRDFLSLVAVHVRRELIDLTRHYAAVNRLQRPAADALQNAADPRPSSPEDLELWSRFHEAIGRLPDDEREVIELVFYDGCTQLQLVEVLEISERTVRRRWQLACLKLNELLGGQFPVAGD